MADGMVGDEVLTDYKAQPKRDCAKDRNKILDVTGRLGDGAVDSTVDGILREKGYM